MNAEPRVKIKLTFLKVIDRRSRDAHKIGLYQCECGNKMEIIMTRVRNGYIKNCGCEKEVPLNKRLLNVYCCARRRCLNPKDKNYNRYGARGIRISEELSTSKAFVEYISTLPGCPEIPDGGRTSLDRIDNDKGYEKGNLRWASRLTQTINRGNSRNKSGYIGVSHHNQLSKWVANISVEKKSHYLGLFNTTYEAVAARNNFIKANRLPHKIQNL